MSTILFATTQLAIAELSLTLNVKPFDIQGMGRNLNYRLPDETWVNPKPTMTSAEQFQALYESAHYYRLFVASNPEGKNQKTGKPSGKAIYGETYVQLAQQTTNGDMFNMFKKFGVKRVGETANTVVTSADNADVKVKIERLRLLKTQGTITALEFAEMCAELQDNAPSEETKKPYDVTAKIRKSPKQNAPKVSDETPMPQIVAKAIKGGYSIRNTDCKKLGIVAQFDETFSATLVNEKNEFLAVGKWIITTIRKTEFSVKRYTA